MRCLEQQCSLRDGRPSAALSVTCSFHKFLDTSLTLLQPRFLGQVLSSTLKQMTIFLQHFTKVQCPPSLAYHKPCLSHSSDSFGPLSSVKHT